MTLILIIGTITSAVGFLLLHQHLDKELASRFLYVGIGASLASLLGVTLNFVTTESIRLYPVFQFVFLCLGVIHALLIFKYQLLGAAFSRSLAFSTLLTLVLVFGASLGFNLVSKAFLRAGSSFCASCAVPFIIPFFVYQTYKQFQDLPRSTIRYLTFDPDIKLPPDDSDETIKLKFFLPRRYTGLRGIKGLIERTFPAHWKLSDAFHETILILSSRESKILLDEQHQAELRLPAEWVLHVKSNVFWKDYLDPSQPLTGGHFQDGVTIHVQRVRML